MKVKIPGAERNFAIRSNGRVHPLSFARQGGLFLLFRRCTPGWRPGLKVLHPASGAEIGLISLSTPGIRLKWNFTFSSIEKDKL